MKCSHLHNVVQLSLIELCKLKKDESCSNCRTNGPNLWICLQKNCLHIGCSEQYKDHSTIHFRANRTHCIHMNLSSQRVWCYLCETELFLTKQQQQQHHHFQHRRTSVVSNDSSEASRYSSVNNDKLIVHADKLISGASAAAGYSGTTTGDSCDSSGEEDDFDKHGKWNGLVGLQNLANTCYMNAALQALSNSPPLTGYFLDCGAILETDLLGGTNPALTKPGLAKHYHKLIREMWCKNRRYVVPSGILCGIRIVHPMFRGYQQHDTQEFLRCFMDQLHEELKEVIAPPPPDVLPSGAPEEQENLSDEHPSPCSSPSPSQSEGEYETCDSGVSERSSLSDDQLFPVDVLVSKRFRKLSTRSSSPHGSGLGNSIGGENPANQRMASYSMRQQSPVSSNRSNASSVSSGSATILQPNSSCVGGGGPGGGGGGGAGEPANEITGKEKLPQRSIISDIFDGKLLSSVQCLTCDRVSTREETFQDLSLPIPGKDHLAVLHQTQGMSVSSGSGPGLSSHSVGVGNSVTSVSGLGTGSSGGPSTGSSSGITCSDAVYAVNGESWMSWFWNLTLVSWMRSWFWGPAVTLHDCMAAFFSADELKGDNMYSCERCNKLRNGVKYSRVLALPEMLCVHLKRFRHDLSYSSKISSPVHFPLYGLNMQPFLHKDCKSEVAIYDLCAVICHHGTVGGGHYTSFAKHDPTDKWFEFDDQLVTQVTPEHVQSCEAYVLFYRKNNAKMATVRAQASNLLTMQEHASDIRFYVSRNWLHRFNTFAEPGPIDNWTLLCPHGSFPPNKASHFSKLVVPFPQALWDFLYKKFGGGPVCNHIFPCHICKKAAETLSRRQRYELETFTAHNDDFQFNDTPTTIYAISMAWFRQWQLFARGLTTDDPGPIQNRSIAIVGDTSVPLRSVRPFSDYAQINANLWHFFHGIYGGGPEIVLQGNPVPPPIPQVPTQVDDQNKQQQQSPIVLPKQRENEPMDVTEEEYSPDARSTVVVKQVDRDSAIEVTITEPPSVQHSISSIMNPAIILNETSSSKPQKSVSFEDTDAYRDDESSSEDPACDDSSSTQKQTILPSDRTNPVSSKRKAHAKASSRRNDISGKAFSLPEAIKRKQYQTASSSLKHTTTETSSYPHTNGGNLGSTTAPTPTTTVHGVDHLGIGTRKDRRYRDSFLKANGFFGPEGKYQSSSNEYANGAMEGDGNSSHHNDVNAGMSSNGRPIVSSSSVPTFIGQSDETTSVVGDAGKANVDELTPMLTHSHSADAAANTNVYEATADMQDDENSSKNGSVSVPSTTSSAKSYNQQRKGHHRNVTNVDNTSDALSGAMAEKVLEGMSFGRRKMKYMKKLAGRANTSGGRGRNGAVFDENNADGGTVLPLAINGIGEQGVKGEGIK
ncbi:ubiquitin carboxyl-terminal hydrolase 20 [Anopheles nili]|uniref:ubiquitin carboxyl-terminal hydrolase 20 n=1 Tax=Anopheles nili TaxID=185578 RepID=UPI00237B5D08|nr:ubiquitin carboxyl-terminal hydrolase 20 [Anopheles nili]